MDPDPLDVVSRGRGVTERSDDWERERTSDTCASYWGTTSYTPISSSSSSFFVAHFGKIPGSSVPGLDPVPLSQRPP